MFRVFFFFPIFSFLFVRRELKLKFFFMFFLFLEKLKNPTWCLFFILLHSFFVGEVFLHSFFVGEVFIFDFGTSSSFLEKYLIFILLHYFLEKLFFNSSSCFVGEVFNFMNFYFSI